MSIVSGTGAAKLTEDVQPVVAAVTRRFDFTGDGEAVLEHVPFCTLKFAEGTEATLTLDVASTSDKSSWDDLAANLPRNQCRMAVAQVPWRALSDNVVRSRLVFILWAPEDGVSVKDRMRASMFSKGIKGIIDGWANGMTLPIQAATVADLDRDDIVNKIRSKATVK